MAIIKTIGEQNTGVSRASEGANVEVRSTRDGSLFRADWKQAMILEGRGFMINLGTLSSPVTGGGAGALTVDIDCPEFVIGVPTGTSILPLYAEICCMPGAGTADNDEVDIILAVDQDKDNGSAAGTSGTAPTIYNMNTLHSRASGCWANQQYSATMTDPVLDLELAHVTKIYEVHAATGTGTGVQWTSMDMKYEPESLVVINGPAMLCGYFGGTKIVSGFACVQWIELPTNAL